MMVIEELQKVVRKTPIFTLANVLSIFRLFLLGPIFMLLREQNDAVPLMAVLLVCLGWLSDGLDGFAARRLGQVSELGKILDPLSDKIFVLALLIFLILLRNFPPWILAIIIPRDLLILWGGLYLARRRKTVEKSHLWGKITTNLLIATVVVYLLGWTSIVSIFLALVVLLAFVSTWYYARFFSQALSQST